jgi:hypothetical protein
MPATTSCSIVRQAERRSLPSVTLDEQISNRQSLERQVHESCWLFYCS